MPAQQITASIVEVPVHKLNFQIPRVSISLIPNPIRFAMHSNLISKIDTKEKMHVLLLEKAGLTAIMTEEFKNALSPYLQKTVKNIVLNFSNIQSVDAAFAQGMVNIQQLFHENKASLVFCNLSSDVKKFLSDQHLLKKLNTTPTESEAWDIVQMEEIEREFL